MVSLQQFPAYFQSEAGGEFLSQLRQSDRPPLAPRLRPGVSERRVLLAGMPRPLPEGVVRCQPAVLDLGAVRRGDSAAGRLSLHNTGTGTVQFRLRPPAPLLGLRVEPRAGTLQAGRELQLLATFQVSPTAGMQPVTYRSSGPAGNRIAEPFRPICRMIRFRNKRACPLQAV